MSFTWLLLKLLKVISQGFLYFRHCSIFKIPFCFLDFAYFLSKALIYYITFSFVCQPLFRSFFQKFLWFLVVSREATYSVYHISFRLSTPFQKLFQKFFSWSTFSFFSELPYFVTPLLCFSQSLHFSLFFRSLFALPCETALLFYHLLAHLSRRFAIFDVIHTFCIIVMMFLFVFI